MFNISTAEPEDFEIPPHFEDCKAYSDEDAICECDEIERELRAEFRAMAMENYR